MSASDNLPHNPAVERPREKPRTPFISTLEGSMRFFFVVIALLTCTLAISGESGQLAGTYRLGGKTFYDPPVNEPQDTHMYFQITGAAAKDLYEKMKTKPIANQCGDEGTQTKVVGSMKCTRGPKDGTRCWFGVDIKRQVIVNAVVC